MPDQTLTTQTTLSQARAPIASPPDDWAAAKVVLGYVGAAIVVGAALVALVTGIVTLWGKWRQAEHGAMQTQLAGLEGRLGVVEGQLPHFWRGEQLEARFGAHDRAIQDMGMQLVRVQATVDGVVDDVRGIRGSIDRLDEKMTERFDRMFTIMGKGG